jgi:hypothetical protein
MRGMRKPALRASGISVTACKMHYGRCDMGMPFGRLEQYGAPLIENY